MFALHTQLAKDCVTIGDLPLSRVLLMNDAQYPWLVLVPRREEIVELFELPRIDQQQLLDEVAQVSAALAGHFRADKMNIAALGNIVPQLHVHIVVRYCEDAAWPKPVWGIRPVQPYGDEALRERIAELEELLASAGLQSAIR
ncbi:MAG TPA: HIT domain-containing protein [Spongiibacteraceae bacterium]|nr:HIT domain-containing protein [Spongiibacteraceae bacterium]